MIDVPLTELRNVAAYKNAATELNRLMFGKTPFYALLLIMNGLHVQIN
jgi:hypothetical protein